MRIRFALVFAFFVGAIALLCPGAGASSRRNGRSGVASFEAAQLAHEPDFALIEKIYKKGQLRSASVRKSMKVDALPPNKSFLGDVRFVWDLFYPDYNCPYGKSRHGRVGDGGKWVCGAARFLSKPGCVIYSLGSNAETSFETDMALETECDIHVFDPTLSSVPMPSTLRSGNKNFHTYAIGNPTQNSTWETKSLDTVMKDFGHSWIDVLKMDIEGGEWEFLDYLFDLKKPIPVGQVRKFSSYSLCHFLKRRATAVALLWSSVGAQTYAFRSVFFSDARIQRMPYFSLPLMIQ